MIPKHLISILCLMALLAIIVLPVQAFTITFANPNGLAERDYMIYNSTGQMVAFVNSTSVVELDTAQDIVIMMKPVQTNPFEDPAAWLTDDAFPYFKTNWIPIILIFAAVGVLLYGRR
jgi:hypothetical protein